MPPPIYLSLSVSLSFLLLLSLQLSVPVQFPLLSLFPIVSAQPDWGGGGCMDRWRERLTDEKKQTKSTKTVGTSVRHPPICPHFRRWGRLTAKTFALKTHTSGPPVVTCSLECQATTLLKKNIYFLNCFSRSGSQGAAASPSIHGVPVQQG